jgi:hypothetical protein
MIKTDQEMDPVIEKAAESQVDNSRPKRKCLIFLLTLALIYGFTSGILADDSPYIRLLDYAFGFISALTVLVWCYLDAEEHNFKISLIFSVCILLLAIIFFPCYIFRTRKGEACFIAIALAVLFMILFFTVNFIGELLGCWVFNTLYV